MATLYENVRFSTVSDDGRIKNDADTLLTVELFTSKSKAQFNILNGDKAVCNVPVTQEMECSKFGRSGVVVNAGRSLVLNFQTEADANSFKDKLADMIRNKQNSVFTSRTDKASAEQYFQFYGYLSQQQNMMQDYIRTSTYQRAMLNNTKDFEGKVVLDVGAGSGILSFFAYQAGARKVYAIEASSMAQHCEQLVQANKLSDKITVIAGKIEEVDLPEQVDIIISEPMGYMLFNERMLETYLHAKKWLKPGGKMFPSVGDLHVTPFTDDSLYMEQYSKANFWYQPSFHGVDLSNLRLAAVNEYFKQPIVDTFDVRICMATPTKYTVDFRTANETDLHVIEVPVIFTMNQSGTVHGLAFWFDVAFIGSQQTVWLSTSPTQPLTHWYQVRCLLNNPIFVKQGQTLAGKVVLRANKRQSYDVDLELTVPGTNTKSCNTLDLKNPFFRYTGVQPAAPPGTNTASPTDSYWNGTDPTGTAAAFGDMWSDREKKSVQVQGGDPYVVSSLLNGGLDPSQLMQQGVAQQNLVPLANASAPVNPGSIPAATIVSQYAQQTRTSVGAGISPALLQQPTSTTTATAFPVSNQFMIGDYVIPGNMVLPTQGLNLPTYNNKGGNV